MSLHITKETKWLCEHARVLEQFSGKWVLFNIKEGLVAKNESLQKVIKSTTKSTSKAFVFHVPSKEELGLMGVATAP